MVFVGNIYDKMIEDGITHKTAALVMHGLAALRPGAVEVLGVPVSDVGCVEGPPFFQTWIQSVGGLPNRDSVPVPV